MTPLKLDLPYPKIKKQSFDPKSVSILAPQYFGQGGEITAILQYNYHASHFEMQGYEELAMLLGSISLCEMIHLNLLAKTILKLGVDPILTNNPQRSSRFYNTQKVSRSKDAMRMLSDNMQGELTAIKDYTNMLTLLENEEAAAIVARIKLDEELHYQKLKELYQSLC